MANSRRSDRSRSHVADNCGGPERGRTSSDGVPIESLMRPPVPLIKEHLPAQDRPRNTSVNLDTAAVVGKELVEFKVSLSPGNEESKLRQQERREQDGRLAFHRCPLPRNKFPAVKIRHVFNCFHSDGNV
ncbi:hypothetical protein F2P81_004223 [Scophthalmus maximus]|uniref:Uncharacterized protein n=1 Tax=Scophthalmus maximus TaxID=52904 RepID=A0A6A4T5M7_SCOMX|nr:hypothetical protein F2P81_004223 [Scophthalmus maximus]